MLKRHDFASAVLSRPAWLLLPLFERGTFSKMSDTDYLRLQYWTYTGKRLRLDSPRTFNEKIEWLKAYDHREIYRTLADKLQAREFFEKNLGKSWLVPLFGVWDSEADIDFDKLPDKFVLKCTHGYGGMILCRNKRKLDEDGARERLKKTLATDFYGRSREWAYCNATPRIIGEQYVDDGGGDRPADYKFMCFNGQVGAVCISRGLGDFSSGVCAFFDRDGFPAGFKRKDYPDKTDGAFPALPKRFLEMRDAAETLARAIDVPFVRVDFYSVGSRAFFSEFTFYPCGGTMFLDPPEADLHLGKMLELPVERYDRNAFSRT
jgi:hypothetical protein